MKEDLGKFNFKKMLAASHYDPEHKIQDFYMERKRAYEHKPLKEEKPSRNIPNEVEMKKICAKVHEEAKKQLIEATIDKRLS